MDGVGISIIGRPRPLPGHDTPNPTQHPYTLKCEEPFKYIYVGEPVVFQTDVPVSDNYLDYPYIVVQPS